MTRRAIAAAGLLLGALAAFGPGAAQHVAACNLAPASLETQAHYAELIVIGEVVSERHVRSDLYDEYESTVRVEATLKGASVPSLTLGRLGLLDAFCTGGQRLEEGERFLLFLLPPLFDGQATTPAPGANDWDTRAYRLRDGSAVNAYASPTTLPADDLIRRTASLVHPRREELAAALAYVSPGEPTAAPAPGAAPLDTSEDGDGLSPWVIALATAGGGIAAAVAAFLVARWLRRAG